MGTMRSFIVITLLAAVGSIFTGCNPSDNKVIVKERQASENLTESMQVSATANTIVLQKSALGKAFLMTPSLVISKRTPEFNDFKPQIVSFERSANRVGLFRLSSNNLYNSIPTDKLLQTFKVVKENSDSITIDIADGFQTLALEESLSIVESETLENNQENADGGLETTVDIKEAMVRKAEVDGNIMYIEQAVRVASLSKVAKEDKEVQNNDPFNKEMTAKVIIEIKPYVLNEKFKVKLFDNTQRVGFFINFANVAGKEKPLPQIAKWDLAEDRAPITVALEENIPAQILEATIEGVTYWNKVAGREVLKIRQGFKATDRVHDRMIIVRWVNWDSAGFAYASIQADPLTGETLRAQIFMTSSWLSSQKSTTSIPLSGLNSKRMKGSCVMEQSQMQLNQAVVSLSQAHQLKYAQDVIRMVVAHEMGHVMGLRHNFAGSFNHEGSDEDLILAQANYLNDEKHSGFAFASTVMDYERGLATALLGAHIKHSVLSYDAAAIGWGYNDQKIELAKDTYCSDEHIALANEQGASVYGCERFDALKNPTLGALHVMKTDINNTIGDAFRSVLAMQNNNDPYKKPVNLEESMYFNFDIDLGVLSDVLYAPKDKMTMVSIETAKSAFDSGFSMKGKIYYEYLVQDKMAEHLVAVGGLSGIISKLLDLENNSIAYKSILQNQASNFFLKVDPSIIGLDIYEKVFIKLTEAAKKQDQLILSNIMKRFVPVFKASFPFKSHEQYKDSEKHPEKYPEQTMRLRDKIKLGDAQLLMRLFKEAILEGKSQPKKALVNNQEIEFQILDHVNYSRDVLLKAFVLENWPTSVQNELRPVLAEQLKQLKEAIAANTVAVLTAAGKPVPALTRAELSKALDEIPSSQIVGISAYELKYNELIVLEKLENIKPE